MAKKIYNVSRIYVMNVWIEHGHKIIFKLNTKLHHWMNNPFHSKFKVILRWICRRRKRIVVSRWINIWFYYALFFSSSPWNQNLKNISTAKKRILRSVFLLLFFLLWLLWEPCLPSVVVSIYQIEKNSWSFNSYINATTNRTNKTFIN